MQQKIDNIEKTIANSVNSAEIEKENNCIECALIFKTEPIFEQTKILKNSSIKMNTGVFYLKKYWCFIF